MTYKLNDAEQATLDSLREKEAFGLHWLDTPVPGQGGCARWYDRNQIVTAWYYDEAAYALMVHRGLKELGAKWDGDWRITIDMLTCMKKTPDILAAILAASEGGE